MVLDVRLEDVKMSIGSIRSNLGSILVEMKIGLGGILKVEEM